MPKSNKNRTRIITKIAENIELNAFEQNKHPVLDLKLLEQQKKEAIIEQVKLLLISGLPRYKIRKQAALLQGIEQWMQDIYIRQAADQIENEFKELQKLGTGFFFKAYQDIYEKQMIAKDYRGAKETYKTLYEMVYGKPTQVIKQDVTTTAPALTIINDGNKIDLRIDQPNKELPPPAEEPME